MKTFLIFFLIYLGVPLALVGQNYHFDFQNGTEGWVGGFADYPVGEESSYELMFARRSLPVPLDTTQYGLYVSGLNRSDDLFMFIKKEIRGLQPNTSYLVNISVNFASKYPTHATGVGGAPGEGVTMKAGITLVEPDTIHERTYVRMNIDKGNQRIPGPDMDTIGHVGVTDTTTVYTLKTNSNAGHPFAITTDSTGNIWVIIGTDSGFEGTTSIYYNEIDVAVSEMTATEKQILWRHPVLYPNPSRGDIYFNAKKLPAKIIIYSPSGQAILSMLNPTRTLRLPLSSGVYMVKGFDDANRLCFTEKIVIMK